MKRILDFFDRAKSAIDDFLDDIPDSQFTMRSVKATTESRSQNTCCSQQAWDTVEILDISGSMDNPDYAPTRLEGGIQAAIEYVNGRATQSP